MPIHKWCLLGLMAGVPALGLASVSSATARITTGQAFLAERERHFWSSAVHDSEFAMLVHTASRTGCGAAELPQALATPDPLLEEAESNAKVSVSFIIETDGRVHSPLILESAGPNEDRTVLDAVRFWRYRPARCNGVPTDAEARVEFSSR
jgi:TonB family protein